MTDATPDPWSVHITRFEVLDAQVTGVPDEGDLFVRTGLCLAIEEGRYEHILEDDDGGPVPSALAYGCSITISGAAEATSWSGIEMQVLVTGRHENGTDITIAGVGALGFDNANSLEVHFDVPPRIAVQVLPSANKLAEGR